MSLNVTDDDVQMPPLVTPESSDYDVPADSDTAKIVIDGMDQSKFKCPRNLPNQKLKSDSSVIPKCYIASCVKANVGYCSLCKYRFCSEHISEEDHPCVALGWQNIWRDIQERYTEMYPLSMNSGLYPRSSHCDEPTGSEPIDPAEAALQLPFHSVHEFTEFMKDHQLTVSPEAYKNKIREIVEAARMNGARGAKDQKNKREYARKAKKKAKHISYNP